MDRSDDWANLHLLKVFASIDEVRIFRAAAVCGAAPLARLTSLSQSARVRRIGFIIGGPPSLIDAFRDALRTFGYIDGRNFFLDLRVASGADIAKPASQLAKGDLELVVAAALPCALEVRRANPRMPVVIATCPGMISTGFAKSLERPGGNVTGMEELPPGGTAKRVTLLKTVAPSFSRVALLSTTPGVGGHETQVAEAEKVAPLMLVRWQGGVCGPSRTALLSR